MTGFFLFYATLTVECYQRSRVIVIISDMGSMVAPSHYILSRRGDFRVSGNAIFAQLEPNILNRTAAKAPHCNAGRG